MVNSRVDALTARGSPISIVNRFKRSKEASCFLMYTYKETIAWFVTWKT